MSVRQTASAHAPRWRVAVAIDEGLRNWRSGRWLTVLASAFVVAALTVPAAVDGHGISRMIEDEQAWEQAGGRMLVVSNEAAGGVDRAACESVSRLDGVMASASVTRLTARAGVPNAPEAQLPLVAVTEGIGPLLRLEPSGGGVLVPRDLADGIGVREGSSLTLFLDDSHDPSLTGLLPEGPVTVGAVTDTSVLGQDLSSAVLLPSSASGRAGSCVVRAGPGYLEAVRAGLPAMLGLPGEDAIVADRLVGGEYARDFSVEYATRGLKQSPWLVGASISLLWLLLVWMRRSRDGLYATLGADATTRAIIRAAEGLALVGTSALLAATVTSATLALTAHHADALVGDVVRHFTIAISLALLGVLVSVLLPLRSPLAVLKDR